MTKPTGIEDLSFLEGLQEEDSIWEECKEDQWGVNDSSYSDYFSEVRLRDYPEGILELIKAQLEEMENPIGLDIAGGANGVALQGLINEGLLVRGVVTNYKDKRSDNAKETPNLDHLSGNIIFPQTWIDIIDWVHANSSEGASLIMHRPYGALQNLYPSFYEGASHKLLDLLRPRGLLFAQIPFALQNRPSLLNSTLCQEIRERPDVEKVIPPVVGLGPLGNCALVIKN